MTWTPWKVVEGFDFKDIIYEKKHVKETGGGVSRVTINRPDKMNAFTQQTSREMVVSFDEASRDPMIGVVVLQGAGDKAFSSGGDVSWEASPGFGLHFRNPQGGGLKHRSCTKPIIAAVRGYCIAGGNHLAYMCDLTLAADNAIFGQNGPRIGSPADGFYVAYLTHVVGAKKAREIWMLCRRYSAQQALEMGLVNAVVPLAKLDEEVDKWCEEILALNPDCIEILKATFDAEVGLLEGIVGSNARWSVLMHPDFFEGPGVKEAQKAFFEKRKPNFWQFRKPKGQPTR